MVLFALNPSIQVKVEAEAFCEFEASQVYIATSRLAPVSEKQKQHTLIIEPETM